MQCCVSTISRALTEHDPRCVLHGVAIRSVRYVMRVSVSIGLLLLTSRRELVATFFGLAIPIAVTCLPHPELIVAVLILWPVGV